jgi:hypothetical protein
MSGQALPIEPIRPDPSDVAHNMVEALTYLIHVASDAGFQVAARNLSDVRAQLIFYDSDAQNINLDGEPMEGRHEATHEH